MSESKKLMLKSNKTYDALKKFAQIVLPALGTLYFALSQIWGLPAGEEIVGTIVAVDAFLGVLLKVSSSNYYQSGEHFDGSIDVYEDDGVKRFNLNLDGNPYELDKKDEVVFRVNSEN